jgi:flagellar basal-body rod protein FlgG
MLDALQIAATGMQAQQLHVDTIANNLANANTAGYKKARVSFHDLVTRVADASLADAAGVGRPLDPEPLAGVGVGIASVGRQFDAGELRRTEAPYDVAIAGDGFVEVVLPDGARAFSRGGALKVNGDGLLALAAGPALAGGIAVPDDAQALVIDPDGRVHVKMHDAQRLVEVGQIALVRFMAPGGLSSLGDGIYRATERSGEPISGRSGDEPIGAIRQGHLEGSNVKMVDEMVALMVAQRAYEASVNVARAADEMLGMANNLRK